MDVELVESPVVLELDFELKLLARHRQIADRARRSDTRTAPGTIRAKAGKFPVVDRCSGFFSKEAFVRHLETPRHARAVTAEGLAQRQMPADRTPDCVNQGKQWKANSVYHRFEFRHMAPPPARLPVSFPSND